jgi:hypothetical protein
MSNNHLEIQENLIIKTAEVLASRIGDLENSALVASEFELPEEEELESDDSAHLYREAAIRFTTITTGAIQFLRNARSSQELLMRLDILSYVFHHPNVREMSFAALGKRHNKTRAAISAAILNFQRAYHLSPTLAQKSTESRRSYTEARQGKLK